MTGVILSGGKNSRMGRNKAFIEIEGERLLDRTIRIFRPLFQEIIVVTNSPLEYTAYDVIIVTDIIREKAALGGIYTGLFFASCEHVFVAACDMPFLNSSFIAYMQQRTASYDVVVPESHEGFQPLHAIYSKACLPAIKKCIETDNLRIRSFYKKSKTAVIHSDVIRSFDQEERMFLNLNSMVELEKIHPSVKNHQN